MSVASAYREALEARLTGGHSLDEVLHRSAAFLRTVCGCELVRIVWGHESATPTVISEGVSSDFSSANRMDTASSDDGYEAVHYLEAPPSQDFFVHDVARSALPRQLLAPLERRFVHSAALLRLGASGWVECLWFSRFHRWVREEREMLCALRDQIVLIAAASSDSPQPSAESVARIVSARPAELVRPSVRELLRRERDEIRAKYDWILRYAQVLVVRTTPDFVVTEIEGVTEELIGLDRDELVGDRSALLRCVHPEDVRRLRERAVEIAQGADEFIEEFRLLHQQSNLVRWIHFRGRVQRNPDGTVAGWEGCGYDITERKGAEEELSLERRRLEALYEVSQVVPLEGDSRELALRGLRALLKATNSDAALACAAERSGNSLEVVAAEGLSSAYVAGITSRLSGNTLLRRAIDSRQPLLVHNLQTDARAAQDLASMEGLRSAIIAPLVADDRVMGAIALFCRRAHRYDSADVELAQAICRQIALVARQAEYYQAERRQASSLAVLYRLSHEITKYLTPRDVAEHAFPIIQEELACKRLWLGVMNEHGTHIIGQAGVGPGVRQSVVNLQIELNLRHDFFDEALRTKQPVIVDPTQPMECSGLTRIVSRLQPGTFVVVPLVALAQVVGVLIVEPAVPSSFFAQRKLPLLAKMAGEIATVILARRFESRMADADKMRMAGMLASGVAHNFNNLLQAVMGQASLIEMQLPQTSPLRGSARMVIDAANRGANLVRQLLSFTVQEAGPHRVPLALHRMLRESVELYQSVLGAGIQLSCDITENLPEVLADHGQLQQVLTNLLVNAKEACTGIESPAVSLSCRALRVNSGEVDPSLAPGEYVRIDLADNGPGMSAEERRRCFEPFFTTKNVDSMTGVGVSGTGLGLSSAYHILRQHEGLITVSSEQGKGTLFSIYLPLPRQVAIPLREGEPRVAGASLLLVGGDERALSLVRTAGAALHLHVRQVARVEDLLHGAPLHGILLFLSGVRDSNTVALLRRVKGAHPRLRVVALGTSSPDDGAPAPAESEIEQFVQPESLWAMHGFLRALLEEKSSTSEEPRAVHQPLKAAIEVSTSVPSGAVTNIGAKLEGGALQQVTEDATIAEIGTTALPPGSKQRSRGTRGEGTP